MKHRLKPAYYWVRDQLGREVEYVIGGNSIHLPAYYVDEMSWTFETEQSVMESFVSLVDPSDTVWDIGAHAGVYSLLAAMKGAETIAIEAYRPNALRGRRLAKRNGVDIDYRVVALGSGESEEVRRGGITGDLRTVTGDGLIEGGVPSPTVAKIDVEGNELAVLRGFSGALESTLNRLVVELHIDLLEQRDESMEDVTNYLEAFGFDIETATDRELEHWQPILIARR